MVLRDAASETSPPFEGVTVIDSASTGVESAAAARGVTETVATTAANVAMAATEARMARNRTMATPSGCHAFSCAGEASMARPKRINNVPSITLITRSKFAPTRQFINSELRRSLNVVVEGPNSSSRRRVETSDHRFAPVAEEV